MGQVVVCDEPVSDPGGNVERRWICVSCVGQRCPDVSKAGLTCHDHRDDFVVPQWSRNRMQDGTRDGHEQERSEDTNGTTASELARRCHPAMILMPATATASPVVSIYSVIHSRRVRIEDLWS